MERSGQGRGVGASVLRKEDDRHLRGRGQFVADIALRGTQEVVFLRSPHAHAHYPLDLRSARRARPGLHRRRPAADQADPGGDAGGRRPLAALAAARDRQGALCRRGDRRLRRADPRRSRGSRRRRHRRLSAARSGGRCNGARAGSPSLVHEYFGDNLFQERTIAGGDIEAAARAAEITVSREYRMNRQSGAPMECRGVLACRDHRLD